MSKLTNTVPMTKRKNGDKKPNCPFNSEALLDKYGGIFIATQAPHQNTDLLLSYFACFLT